MSKRNRLKKRKIENPADLTPRVWNQEQETLIKVDSLADFIVDDEEESYNPDHRGEYFDLDTQPLQKELVSALSDSLNFPTNKIWPVVSSVFQNMAPYMIDDYFSAKPSNNNWKVGEESKIIRKLEPQLLELRNEMEDETPNIPKILEACITKDEKKKALRLFDQMNNVDPYSSDYFRLMDSINELLGKSNYYSKEDIKFLESEEKKLKNMFVNSDSLKTKILKLNADSTIKAKLLSQYEEMMTYPSDSSYYMSMREEIEWSLKLPYQKREEDPYVRMNNLQLNKFYCDIRRCLDSELYGMEKVKERIIHVLNDRRTSEDACGRNICLIGSPGTGKTQICKVLAKILNKKFAKISAGALDSAAIKGSNRVYVGSEPSILLQIMANLQTNNVIIMVDEIEKADRSCQHAFLHVSDASDNKEFQDNYLKNFSHDLSKLLFIFNLNDENALDPALKDRFDIIHVDDYTIAEKVEIFKNYMLPRTLENIGMAKNDVVVTENAIRKLLNDRPDYTLRSVEKLIKDLIGKINMYRSVILNDGTLGNLKLNYKIPNFKIPLKIDSKLLFELI